MVDVILLVVVAFASLTEGIFASCNNNEFPCNDGSCVNRTLWCDTTRNCKDGSDEDFCFRSALTSNPNKCNTSFFICHDGPCIPIVGLCDGLPSCPDKSDEKNCSITTEVPSTKLVSTKEIVHTTTPASTTQTETHLIPSKYQPNITYQHDADIDVNVHDNIRSDSTVTEITYHHDIALKVAVHDNIQSDYLVAETKKKKYLPADITKGFEEVDKHFFIHEKAKAEAWLLATRDNEYGWGDETARAITALYLSHDYFLKKSSDETMLMMKQLHLKVSIALVRNQTTELPLTELASFINALRATCENPRNFYGQDLVNALRHRTNVAQASDKFVSPLVYLTLCISQSTTSEDIRQLQSYAVKPKIDKMDMHALVSLAATCISSTDKFSASKIGPRITRGLYDLVTLRGLPENIYELSLVVQALNEGRINQDRWHRSDALHRISSMQQENGSFGDILSTYYTLPLLSSISLISLTRHCYLEVQDMVPVDVLMNGNEEKYYVSYSLYFGQPVEVSQTLRIKVGKSTNFLDIMRIAASINPMYKFRFDGARRKPLVYSIGGIVNDAEQGLYWNMYRSTRNSTAPENLQPYDGDIGSFIPTADDHVVFWIKNLH